MNVSDLPQPGAWINGQKMSSIGQQIMAALRFAVLWLWASGPTSARPSTPVLGQLFYDTTLGGLIVCTNAGAPMSGTAATWGPVDGLFSYSYQSVLTGFSYTIPNGVNLLQLHMTTGIGTGTVTMPSAPLDGQEIVIATDHGVTTFTVSPNAGQSINAAPATIAANTSQSWWYHAADTTWYRLQ
jgi:hypothetical protein